MRRRPSSRLLLLNPDSAVLLFRFVHKEDALAGLSYWATPGGGLEDGETFEEAAIRELFEETGIRHVDPGSDIGRREFVLLLPSGEEVTAEERFFLIRHDGSALSREGWTEAEVKVMADHRWWSRDDLARTTDKIFPENILAMLASQG
ncbi:MAG: NUDIX domain-containing protein [Azospirillum brasilense]|uniref:NUDIX hydrolase n=1 Tax=Roseomonas TaxID=125216 RepID=UPI000951AE8C|nr:MULTISPECIES: NUDIX domain-containing protein [Roseomonas]MDT8266459.1 NUDIX domain-containing protein [Roseomonas sp. DSM 102946]PZP39715.1 MAG: NUDIX domain-containing protein [Azospirillum brasilense]